MAGSCVNFWVVGDCDYHSGTFPTSSGLAYGCCVRHIAICDDRVFVPTSVGEESLLAERWHSPRVACFGGFVTGPLGPHVAAYSALISNGDRCRRLAFDDVYSVACYRCAWENIGAGGWRSSRRWVSNFGVSAGREKKRGCPTSRGFREVGAEQLALE